MALTGTYQERMFGMDSERVIGWRVQITDVMKSTPMVKGESDSDYNRRVYATLLTADPKLLSVISMLVDPTVPKVASEGVALVFAWMCRKEYPAPDTIARALREAKAACETDYRLDASPLTLDSLLNSMQARKSTEKYCHDISEPRVHRALNDAFPELEWCANKKMKYKGNVFMPDLVEDQSMIAIEIDSFAYHSEIDCFVRDRQKSRWLTLMGYRVMPYPQSQLSMSGGLARLVDDVRVLVRRDR